MNLPTLLQVVTTSLVALLVWLLLVKERRLLRKSKWELTAISLGTLAIAFLCSMIPGTDVFSSAFTWLSVLFGAVAAYKFYRDHKSAQITRRYVEAAPRQLSLADAPSETRSSSDSFGVFDPSDYS